MSCVTCLPQERGRIIPLAEVAPGASRPVAAGQFWLDPAIRRAIIEHYCAFRETGDRRSNPIVPLGRPRWYHMSLLLEHQI